MVIYLFICPTHTLYPLRLPILLRHTHNLGGHSPPCTTTTHHLTHTTQDWQTGGISSALLAPHPCPAPAAHTYTRTQPHAGPTQLPAPTRLYAPPGASCGSTPPAAHLPLCPAAPAPHLPRLARPTPPTHPQLIYYYSGHYSGYSWTTVEKEKAYSAYIYCRLPWTVTHAYLYDMPTFIRLKKKKFDNYMERRKAMGTSGNSKIIKRSSRVPGGRAEGTHALGTAHCRKLAHRLQRLH